MALPGLITVSPSSSELVATMQRVKPSIAGQEQARPGCALCADASNESNALTHTEASLENSNNQTKASLPPLPAARAGHSQPRMHPHPWPSVGSTSRSCLPAKLTAHKQQPAHTQASCGGHRLHSIGHTSQLSARLPQLYAAATMPNRLVWTVSASHNRPHQYWQCWGFDPAPSRQWHTAMRRQSRGVSCKEKIFKSLPADTETYRKQVETLTSVRSYTGTTAARVIVAAAHLYPTH